MYMQQAQTGAQAAAAAAAYTDTFQGVAAAACHMNYPACKHTLTQAHHRCI